MEDIVKSEKSVKDFFSQSMKEYSTFEKAKDHLVAELKKAEP